MSEGPSTSITPLSTRDPKVARVEIELDRAQLAIKGAKARTCVQCGVGRAEHLLFHKEQKVSLSGLHSCAFEYSICALCLDDAKERQNKMARAQQTTNFFYYVQFALFIASFTFSGATLLLPFAVALFLATWASSSVYKRYLSRAGPKLLKSDKEKVTLLAPKPWARVLGDEAPKLLKSSLPY